MSVQKYANYLEVSPLFESVVDINADQRNPHLWQEYIVGEDMEALVECLCQSLGNEAPDLRRSFWVHGSYGTGKSYAAIFVKHLLEEPPETINAFMANHQVLSRYRSRFMKCRQNGDYLVIWKTGCTGIRSGDMMLLEAEKAVREALIAKFGDKADLGTGSLLNAVKAKLNSSMIAWENVLENTTLGDDYSCVDELRAKVESGDLKALQRTAAVIRQYGWGLIDNLETFEAWIAEVIDANGLARSGTFFIWDEFTEYVNHCDDHTVMQQLSEFCKVKPFFMLYVVHRSDEMVDSMGKERYQTITHRFHTVEFHISADASYDLIAGSFGPRPGMDAHWQEERRAIVKEIRPSLPDMVGLDDNITERIELLCPMHPMTIKLLARVAESYAAAQRTLFRFMKDQSEPDQGFIGYINTYGPYDQAKWLTAEWLWDYFFTRESDFSDKDTKAAEYIRHFEENRHLVERDENTFRVFKVAMLLLAVTSSTKGIYGGVRAQGGIAATVECLQNCLAGTMTAQMVQDKLDILEDDKVLNRDAHGNVTRLQMPFKSVDADGFQLRKNANDKKYTRYQMFAKDGFFSSAFEKRALDENDPLSKRIKVAVCCAESLSIKNRLEELQKELERFPYKLGLLLVSVKDETQALSIHAELERLARDGDERMVIALLKTPFTDEKRMEWLTRMTKSELASEGGQTRAADNFKREMEQIVTLWVEQAVSGKITAWHGTQVFSNQYGMAQLRKTIEVYVMQALFPYAPEAIVVTSTAYKSCNDPAPLVGITRSTNNSQMKSVLSGMQAAGIMDAATIHDLAMKDGNKGAKAIAAVARLVEKKMTSGQRVSLGDLWEQLQRKPFGYYDTIACGVLLGFVFSYYKDSAYSWIDNALGSHILDEQTLKTMVWTMCKGRVTTDYLSAGSIMFQNFRDYAKAFFGLTDMQVANETECWHNIREAITKNGSPLWALKYMRDEAYINPDYKKATLQVVDALQKFVMQEHDRDGEMNEVVKLMTGRGKIKKILQEAFHDKAALAEAFRCFLFDASPDLKAIADKLALQSEPLNDKLHQVMQTAIYTWTEAQVREKLANVVQEYLYLDALNGVIGRNCHDIAEARRELINIFKFFRLPMEAVEKMNLPWFDAMKILCKVAHEGIAQETSEQQRQEIEVLRQYGKDAMSALRDAKPVLSLILESRGLECTKDELDSVYAGIRDMTYDTSIGQFENALKEQTARVGMARNRALLLSKWTTLTGEESVKSWCVSHKAPIQWIVPKEYLKAIETVIEVQKNMRVMDQKVINALQLLDTLDVGLVTDDQKIEAAMIHAVGSEYRDIWQAERDILISMARQKNGADMSTWGVSELISLQRMLKEAQQEKAKKEKLTATISSIRSMEEPVLRSRIAAFLERHPEFCDSFIK